MVQFQQKIGASYDDDFAEAASHGPVDPSAMFGHIYKQVGKAFTHAYYDAFLRFLLNIPVGSTINSAYLTLYSYEARVDDFTSQINYTNEDDALDFSTNPFGRANATTNVPWTVPDFPSPPNTVQTVDITSLIQHFIDRAGYNENNHIALRIQRGDAFENEYQKFYQWDGNADYAAVLTINYTPPGAPAGYQYGDGLVCVQVR